MRIQRGLYTFILFRFHEMRYLIDFEMLYCLYPDREDIDLR